MDTPRQPWKARNGRAGECRGDGGFTLLELVVVCIILMIITGMTVPLYRDSVASMRADRALTSFVSALKYAQERAVTDGVEVRIFLDLSERRYWLAYENRASEDEPEWGDETVFDPLPERLGTPRRFPESLYVSSVRASQRRGDGVYYVSFYPSGASDAAVIYMHHEERRRPIEIELQGRMGRIAVREPQ